MFAGPDEGALRLGRFETMLGWFDPGTLVDLGAGHGAFSIKAADLGWKVTAVDARVERFPEDSRVKWVEQDIREVDLSPFDLVVNLGLFYHLTLADQLSLLDRAAGKPMILDTHFAAGDAEQWSLSDLVTVDGYEGRYFPEEGVQEYPTASFGNLSSFWPTLPSLQRMLFERGWDVYISTPHYLTTRTFFACVPR